MVLSAAEAADMLDVSVDTLYRRWRSWGLRGFYVGRQLRFRCRDVEHWIERKVAG